MGETLKPCPLCGGEAGMEAFSRIGGNTYYAECRDIECCCKGPAWPTEAEAASAWNGRWERTCRIAERIVDWDTGEADCQCTECGFSADPGDWVERYRYCPGCGARVMLGE